ncbi:AAA family ATPase [Winogradskyella sp.]|uniref:AAA family ATPase n=1 Tax=Winogradskyella sp. TaxID=1883156 RepID=UPI0026313B44|nr:AAA family ATPase [Winogradskyella sp.]
MIYVDRNTVNKPEILESDLALKAFEKMRYFHMEDVKSDFRRYKFHPFVNDKEVRETLKTLFNGKCAYCENHITAVSSGDNDLFRPKAGAMNTDGSFDPDHYWWLAYEWYNMYFSCTICNRRYKRNNFPVEGARADIMGDLSIEKPLLLDPCQREDFAIQHIGYNMERAVGLTKRGNRTIKILGLNRNELLKSRRTSIKRLENALQSYSYFSKSDQNKEFEESKKLISSMLRPESPYLACKWGNFADKLLDFYKGQVPDYLPFYQEYLGDAIAESEASPEIFKANVQTKQPSRKFYSLDKLSAKNRNEYFGQSRWITKVRIRNFKIIEDLELKFAENESTKEPWMALLGENGTGKSTILQAIALTLAGQERLDELNLNASKFVNRNTKAKSGSVRVYLNDRKNPITLTFSKSSKKFSVTPKAPQLIVRAYGATRLFSEELDFEDKDFMFVDNLFNPLELLLNGNKWLTEKINDEKLFPEIARSLADLLSLNKDQYFYPEEDENGNKFVSLKLYPNKEGIPLDDLSAGYKAILALALDIMMGFGQIWPSIFNAQGIVLVDEIGVHLHPRWKMRIIDALRKTFSGINFIIATHEPLCLRGLEQGEVILMKLDENKEIEMITNLPSPKRMRVGQLLTSVFGLHTTLDPELEELFSEFNQLQSIRRKRSREENNRFEELKVLLKDDLIVDADTGQLRPNTLLGDTVSEIIAYKVIEDKYQDDSQGNLKENLESLKQDKLEEIKNLWGTS